MNKCARHRHAIAEQWWYIANKFVIFSSQLTQVEFYANQVENVLHHAALVVCKYSLRNAAEDHLHKRLTDLEEILAPFFQQADTNLEATTSTLTASEAMSISVQEILKGRFPSPAITLDETNKAGNAACVKNAELRGERATFQASYPALEQAAGRLAQEAEGYEQEVVRGRSALVEVEKELTRAQTRVRELERRLEEATQDGAALKTSKDELQATVASLREQVGSDKTRISFMEATIAAGGDSSKALTEEMQRVEAARQLEKDAREACEREMATLRRDLENMTHLKSDIVSQLQTRSISVEETLKRRFPSPPIRKKFEELDTQSPSPSKEASLLERSPLSNNIPKLQSAHISTLNATSARHISSPAPRQTMQL
jgi:chromosome segregation ATPase